jgi:hypothetical protein
MATGSAPIAGQYANGYNRNVGMEYNLASSNNLWTGKLLGLKIIYPGVKGRDFVKPPTCNT